MEYKDITCEQDGHGVVTVTLNRPERLNAIGIQLVFEMIDVLERVEADESAKVIVVTGAGRAFCSGADQSGERPAGVSELTEDYGYRRATRAPIGHWGVLFQKLGHYPKPIIAAVNGVAAGGGLSLALIADIRIASTESSYIAVFIRRGLVPDTGASFLLPQFIGPGRASEMMMTGRRVSVEEANEWGLLNKLVAPEDLMAEATAMARQIAKGPSLSIEVTKRLIMDVTRDGIDTQLQREAWGQNIASSSEDVREGVQSFLEKREPNWKGR
jgi:2-(1,2-epoxy-1,2-dihydrophenyl)acetyl-CoA isomerase